MKSLKRVLFVRYAAVSIPVVLVIGSILMVEDLSETVEWLTLIIGLIVFAALIFLVTCWTEKTFRAELSEIGRGLEMMVVDNDIDNMPQPKLPELKGLATDLDTVAGKVRRNIRLLQSERERFKAFLDNVDAGLILFDTNGKVKLINSAAEDLLGIRSGFASERTMAEINPSTALDRAFAKASAGEKVEIELEIWTPQNRMLRVVAGPVITDKGGTRGTIVVLNDITVTRHLETVRTDFVANVSHELRTPVANLRAVVDALMAGGMEDSEKARKFLDNINRESTRLMRIIEDLLVLSRIESDRVSMLNETVKINKLVGDVVGEEEDHAGIYDVELVFNESGEEYVVEGDRRLLKTALVNLFDNAIKYNKPGGKVHIYTEVDAGQVSVSVEDTGVGIPRKDTDRIFERFFRVDRARSRETGGTGLGLSIVKHIAELHGGVITVVSVEGQGSTFVFTVPSKTGRV